MNNKNISNDISGFKNFYFKFITIGIVFVYIGALLMMINSKISKIIIGVGLAFIIVSWVTIILMVFLSNLKLKKGGE